MTLTFTKRHLRDVWAQSRLCLSAFAMAIEVGVREADHPEVDDTTANAALWDCDVNDLVDIFRIKDLVGRSIVRADDGRIELDLYVYGMTASGEVELITNLLATITDNSVTVNWS